jgi:hypothetical protein
MENTQNTVASLINVTAQEFVNEYKQFTRKSAESSVEMARVVYSAKLNLSPEGFDEFCTMIGYEASASTISKMVTIGSRFGIFSKYYEQLPVQWTTLYHIAKQKDANLIERQLAEKVIHSLMSCKEFLEMIEGKKQNRPSVSKLEEEANYELKVVCTIRKDLNAAQADRLKEIIEELKTLTVDVDISTNIENLLFA